MGFSVQLFETLAWAEALLERRVCGRRCRVSPACTRGPDSRASPDAPRQLAANAHRATELEMDSRYDACEPGYASFVEALASVYCGDLDRYVELTCTVTARLRP